MRFRLLPQRHAATIANGPSRPTSSVLLIAAVVLLLSGCGPLVTLYANQAKFDQSNDTTRPQESKDAFLLDAADRFGAMALFAEVVYRRDLEQDARDGNGCAYLKSEQTSRYGMPRQANGSSQWMRWIPRPSASDVMPCFDEFGLYYETYIHVDDDGKITEAAIAFRGTENRAGQYLYDWGTNFAAALGLEPKQYELASKHIPNVIKGLRERFMTDGRDVRIYATGHSLGGGLAQQAGYLSKDIKEVFTFDTTPVTNWSSLRTRGSVQNGYPIIYRIYHGGEFLEKVRFVSTSVTQARYGRHDIGLQFVERSDFSGHSMQIIACNLARLITFRTSAGDAAHHYPVQFILDHVLDDGRSESPSLRICRHQSAE